jgi:hypothetical protein
MALFNIILFVLVTYLVCGLLFTGFFITKGVDKIDEGARGASTGFRIIIVPGSIVFWPFLLKKWINSYDNKKTND